MSDARPELDRVLAQVEPRWDAARSERTLPGARGKLAAGRRRRVVAGAALALALVAGGAAWLTSPQPGVPRAAAGYVVEPGALRFADGSRALLLDPAARVEVTEISASAIRVGLPAGRARFEVSKQPGRTFRVECGDVAVEVLGTAFELLRQGARTHVQVSTGRVAVRWSGGEALLTDGAEGWFPPVPGAPPGVTGPAPEQGATRSPEPTAEATAATDRVKPASSWRQHAEQGEFGQAYALLEQKGARVADDVEELLLAADAARLSGHPAEAVPYLQKVVERHAGDPRAPLSAFTLGGVLMNQLGRPREAELAYGRARKLSPEGSLAQDALARQVEAAHRAGDQARSRTLSLQYQELYPNGRRLNAVRRFGGLP
jgi:transmembrane sensor